MRIVLKPTGIALVLLGLVVLAALALRPQGSPATPPSPSPVTIARTIDRSAPALPPSEGVIYDHKLNNGWANASWAKTDIDDTKYSRLGAVIRINSGASQALYLHHDPMSLAPYDRLAFRINGGKEGGQALKLIAQYDNNGQKSSGAEFTIPHLIPGPWRAVTVPLAQLGVAGRTDFTGFWIQESTGQSSAPTYYVSDVQLLRPSDPEP